MTTVPYSTIRGLSSFRSLFLTGIDTLEPVPNYTSSLFSGLPFPGYLTFTTCEWVLRPGSREDPNSSSPLSRLVRGVRNGGSPIVPSVTDVGGETQTGERDRRREGERRRENTEEGGTGGRGERWGRHRGPDLDTLGWVSEAHRDRPLNHPHPPVKDKDPDREQRFLTAKDVAY